MPYPHLLSTARCWYSEQRSALSIDIGGISWKRPGFLRLAAVGFKVGDDWAGDSLLLSSSAAHHAPLSSCTLTLIGPILFLRH